LLAQAAAAACQHGQRDRVAEHRAVATRSHEAVDRRRRPMCEYVRPDGQLASVVRGHEADELHAVRVLRGELQE
jgi:hypothetical protein